MRSPIDRRARTRLAEIGEVIGDPSRAAMLVALMGGASRTASELAVVAEVAPSTASGHLKRLVDVGLLVRRAEGRTRHYALAGPRVAELLERLATLGARPGPARPTPEEPLRLIRTCYGHLAGRVSVELWRRAWERGWIEWRGDEVQLLPAGVAVFQGPGLLSADSGALLGRACLDWSERVPHVCGPLGIALCRGLLEQGWVKRLPDTRALRITTRGRAGLASLGVAS